MGRSSTQKETRLLAYDHHLENFVSRWFFELKDSNDPIEVDRLCGMLGHDLSEEITEHEYPKIAAAHATCELEEPFFDKDADQETQSFTVLVNLNK